MTWNGIHGHDRIAEQFRRALERERLASSFLFIGKPGIGKRTFALKLAQALLCESNADVDLNPCGACPACHQVVALTHPDLILVSKPADKSYIPIELFIGDREHRMRVGLCHDISLKPFGGRRKIAIIDDADFMNQEGANCLLKTLEEPPPDSVLILIGTNEHRQLSTIRSRCQIVRFQPLEEQAVAELLVVHGHVQNPQQAQDLAGVSQGSIERALELADSQVREFRLQLLEQLAQADVSRNDFAKALSAHVDAAGKDATPRRERMIQTLDFAADFYRQLMRSLGGCEAIGDEALRRAVASAASTWPADDEAAAACLDRCLQAQFEVLSNANQATLIECWLDDLSCIGHSGVAPAGHI